MTRLGTEIESIKNRVIKELTRLNLMGTRMPYTAHHDYIRMEVSEATHMSRADVAQLEATEDDLWACAFIQVISGMSDYDVHAGLYAWCFGIAKDHLDDIERQLIED